MPDQCPWQCCCIQCSWGTLPRRRVVKDVDVVLVGRLAEREVLGGLLARAADGYSSTLVLHGEAGSGKTALLDDTLAAAAAAGMQAARLTGVEPETQLGYAGVHRFLLPFAGHVERLPVPQRDALRSTFGLVAGPPADRFLVALGVLTLLAWRGRETDARRIAAAVTREATGAGRDTVIFAQYSLAVLELGLGNHQAALRCALSVFQDDHPFLGTHVLPELVEAAARCGETGLAEAALGRLAERAAAAGTPLALGLLARSRALLASDADAEPLYADATGHLKQCQATPQLARAYLIHGEWLRRQRRRRDARERLRTAHEMFTSISAEAFAERARIELLATGERSRQRTAPATDELTPQEAQIARLVSEGESNRDIAAQLFVSPATVDFHLRKLFRKLGVASRT